MSKAGFNLDSHIYTHKYIQLHTYYNEAMYIHKSMIYTQQSFTIIWKFQVQGSHFEGFHMQITFQA